MTRDGMEINVGIRWKKMRDAREKKMPSAVIRQPVFCKNCSLPSISTPTAIFLHNACLLYWSDVQTMQQKHGFRTLYSPLSSSAVSDPALPLLIWRPDHGE
jgi:hypothetical protein